MADRAIAMAVATPGRTAQTWCGCIFAFEDGIKRRLPFANGIDVFEVKVIKKCRRVARYCYLVFNSIDRCYYLAASYKVEEPNDALAAELGAQFG